jgi:hypothetical protein
MPFKVFLSFSFNPDDIRFVDSLATYGRHYGMELYRADQHSTYGKAVSLKVTEAIRACDCLVAILTESSVRSPWVNQEIGIAHDNGKLIIPVVENGVKPNGILEGREYLAFYPSNHGWTVHRAVSYLAGLKFKKEKRERQNAIGWGIVVLLGILGIASLSEGR